MMDADNAAEERMDQGKGLAEDYVQSIVDYEAKGAFARFFYRYHDTKGNSELIALKRTRIRDARCFSKPPFNPKTLRAFCNGGTK